MVTPPHARRGATHGLPADDEWHEGAAPAAALMELVRTPSYLTWQGERWPFHCDDVMQYLGRWGRADFAAAAPDGDDAALALAVVGLGPDEIVGLGETPDEGGISAYVFRCRHCPRLGGGWDCD